MATLTRQRKNTAERREQIACAVLRVIEEKGVKFLTTAALAEEVGLSSGALFRHFESMDAILLESVRLAVGKIEVTFPDSSLPPLERLIKLAGNRVELIRKEPGLAWLLRSDEAGRLLPLQGVQLLEGVMKRSRLFLLKAIKEGGEAGAIRKDIKPEILLVFVTGMIHSLVGMPAKSSQKGRDVEAVLSSLVKLLSPNG